MGDYHARFCESLMGRFHWATRLLENSIDITDKVMTLALEKLYDEYDLDLGDELCIAKKEELKTTKFELKK